MQHEQADNAGRSTYSPAIPSSRPLTSSRWRLVGFGQLVWVGMEDAGAYGAALSRFLRTEGCRGGGSRRPDRKTRRAKGKSGPVDAYAAALAALSGRSAGIPKSRDGQVEAIRALWVTRRRPRSQNSVAAPDPFFACRRHFGGSFSRLLGGDDWHGRMPPGDTTRSPGRFLRRPPGVDGNAVVREVICGGVVAGGIGCWGGRIREWRPRFRSRWWVGSSR